MKNRISRIFILTTLCLSLFACASNDAMTVMQAPAASAELSSLTSYRTSNIQGDALEVEATRTVSKTESDSAVETVERLIIRNGNLSITVENTEEALQAINNLATSTDGWVVSSNSTQYGESLHGTINIRFPAEQFDEMIGQIQELAIEVENISTTGQDVTDEFIDLGSRLGNLEATADRVRLFLDETENVEEALAVNQELSRLEGEIEVIKGRMKFLSESAAYSTLTIQIRPDIVAQPITVSRWLPSEVAENATEALLETLQGLANFAIWAVIYMLPVGILIGLPLWFAGRWVVRKWQERRRNRAALQPAAAAAE